LLAQNSTFFISNQSVDESISITPSEPDEEQTIQLPELDDIVFASSNYVVQNPTRRLQLVQSKEQERIQNPQPTVGPVQGPVGGGASAQISSY